MTKYYKYSPYGTIWKLEIDESPYLYRHGKWDKHHSRPYFDAYILPYAKEISKEEVFLELL